MELYNTYIQLQVSLGGKERDREMEGRRVRNGRKEGRKKSKGEHDRLKIVANP